MTGIPKGYLGSLFTGVVAKRLTLVETVTDESNQHEFQGIKLLRSVFGTEDRKGIPTKFVWLEAEQSVVSEDGFVSWSNVRKGKPRSAEYHLYYSGNSVTETMGVGDTAFIALRPSNEALVVIVPKGSSILESMYWLFGISEAEQLKLDIGEQEGVATFKEFSRDTDAQLDFAARLILDELGIEFELPEAAWLDSLLVKYPNDLPTTKEFSAFARETCNTEISAAQEPDALIMAWLDHEEKLFRRHEHHSLAKRLNEGFMSKGAADVEGFIEYSKRVLQRRSSRMGYSLEQQLAALFRACGLRFTHGAITERKSKPDFVFPGIKEYHDLRFDESRLTILASKATAKDRWRQVIAEADRVNVKHVFTLQRGISVDQTDEMKFQNIHLVLPRALHASYREQQRSWLWDLQRFIALAKVRDNQTK